MSGLTGLQLQSEPYAATGNIGDGGFRRLLGTPSLEVLQLVIRESIQNSCDAAKLGSGPEVLIRLRTLTPGEVAILRDAVLCELPFVAESRGPLEAFLASPQPQVLEICDFGATGLGGPTRADRLPVGTTRTDFIDFLRNVGTQRNTRLGGGTYGFGKASLYMASRCSTILVDTLAVEADGEDRRLMGCHLGPSGEEETGDGFIRRFTGRHWWGVRDDDDITEPASGGLAEAIAAGLGLPARPAGATGTTIMILDPDLGLASIQDDPSGDDEPEAVLEDGECPRERAVGRIAGALLWNFWPRMMASTPASRRLSARLFLDDREIELPAPEELPPLDHYAAAMDVIRSRGPGVTEVRKYGRILGRIALVKGLRNPRVPPFDEEGCSFARSAAGIAVMRPVELVVRVEPGPALPDERVEWAGVFLASEEADIEEAFARSEPAAHDAWDPSTLADEQQKKFVKAALRRIREVARSVAAPEAPPPSGASDTVPLAAVAGRLGQFMKGLGHGGPSSGAGAPGGGGGLGAGRRRRVSSPVFSRLQVVGGAPAAEFLLTLSGAGPEDTLVILPQFAVDGTAVPLEEGPSGPRPRILSVTGPSGAALAGLGSTRVDALEGEVRVLVSVPPDCAVTVKARLETAS